MSVYIAVQLQRQIRLHFRDCCAYCQTAEALTVVTFEFEHIVPLAAGGETKFENLALACPSCNRYKSDRQTAIDPLTNTAVALFHPQQQVWRDHFQWNDTATEIEGLTAIGRATISALRMNRPALTRVRSMWVKLGEHPPS
ncbi:MAG: HNH endonuclease [Prochlorotrichaceae cyanobacterium]|jgi:phosphoribosylaminoimidazole carboxylase (NCAIR synthetase)